MQKWRKDIGEMNLPRVAEISTRKIEILRHHAERKVLRAKNPPYLAHHFFHADVGASVARAIVSGKKKFELSAGLPCTAGAQHPFELVEFDQPADPGLKEQVGHGRGSPE